MSEGELFPFVLYPGGRTATHFEVIDSWDTMEAKGLFLRIQLGSGTIKYFMLAKKGSDFFYNNDPFRFDIVPKGD
jgi:hypothetical protein